MPINNRGALLLASIALFVSGCETTTVGQGVVQGANGKGTDSVSFHIKETLLDDQASVTASFASGDRYTGKFVISRSDTSSSADIWDSNDSSDGLFASGSSTTYHSKATGVLFGPSGKTMECGMTLASPSVGFSGGGVGKCKLSTGQVIPLQLNES